MTRPPRLHRTRPVDLIPPMVIVGALVHLLLALYYDRLPPLHYQIAAPMAVLAVAELVLARRVRGAVRHDPAAKPMPAIVIARCVALGKASALVGAALGGAAIALLMWTYSEASHSDVASKDVRVAAALLVVAVAITVSGLALERAGVDPRSGGQPPVVGAD